MSAIWEEEYEPEIFMLPKLSDCINFENTSEVPTSIATLFNSITLPTGFGDTTEFWRFLQNQYGEHRIMWNYTVQYPTPVYRVAPYNPDLTRINKALLSVFNASNIKYTRLIASLNATYDPLKPYNIEEEHSTGQKSSKTTMGYASRTDTTAESSMDSTALNNTMQTVNGSHNDTIDRSHDVSTTFDGDTFESGSDETSHSKDSRVGNIGNHSFAELIEKEIKLTRFTFWDMVAKDITDMVCLKIFASC